MKKTLLTSLLVAGAITLCAAEVSKPNVVIILTDDQGYADLGIQGIDPDVRTPQLDRLAREGVRFTRGYATAPQCGPSRAGLISCRHQNLFGIEENRSGPLPLSETSTALPARLRDAGYVTGMVGKWSLAHDKQRGDPKRRYNVIEHLPHNFGFEEYWMGEMDWFYASHDLQNKPLENPPQIVDDTRYRVAVQTEAALAFLKRREDDKRPFFLYLAYFAPHAPMEAPPQYLERLAHVKDNDRRMGLASILAVDDGVGQIRKKLAEMGQAENTLIFFMSDNGAPLNRGAYIGSRNDPVVGEKGMLTDGGVRIPYLAAWPGKIPGGQVIDGMVSTLDASATALAVAKASVDDWVEGVNLMPLMMGEQKEPVHDALFWRWRSQAVIRSGQWTMVMLGNERRYLFDNRELGSETAAQNRIKEFPEIAANLEQKLRKRSDAWQDKGLIEKAEPSDRNVFDIHIERTKPGTHPMQTPWTKAKQ